MKKKDYPSDNKDVLETQIMFKDQEIKELRILKELSDKRIAEIRKDNESLEKKHKSLIKYNAKYREYILRKTDKIYTLHNKIEVLNFKIQELEKKLAEAEKFNMMQD